MSFEDMLREDLIFVKKCFGGRQDAIVFLAQQLEQKGFVDNDFAHAVIEREEKYPTGLYLGEINVAIPHTEVKHVRKSGVAILTLSKPLLFNRMDDPSQSIPVHIVFLLAASESNEYAQFLAKLTANFSNGKDIKRIYKEVNPAKIFGILNSRLSKNRIAFKHEKDKELA